MRKLILLLLTLIAAASCAAQAEKPEGSLAGVRTGVSISEVKRVLGAPVRVIDTPNTGVSWRSGEREYECARGVKVIEGYYQKPDMPSEHSSGVLSVVVQANGSADTSAKTGRGLALGDSAQTVRKIYGRAPVVNGHIQIHWSNGNILDVDLNAEGRVVRIGLSVNQA